MAFCSQLPSVGNSGRSLISLLPDVSVVKLTQSFGQDNAEPKTRNIFLLEKRDGTVVFYCYLNSETWLNPLI